MNDAKKNSKAPEDSYNKVYMVFIWLGIGTLLPWNFFIAVSEYWKYKLRTVNSLNGTAEQPLNDYQLQWNSTLSVASMLPNVTFLTLNAIFGHKFRTQPRLLVSLLIVILIFILTCTLSKMNSDDWQSSFYIVTLTSVVLINVNSAIFQGGLLGIAGKFPAKYINAVFAGQALGGIFASATNVLMLLIGANSVNAAFFSFLIAVLFLSTAFVSYIAATKSHFFQYYETPIIISEDVTHKLNSAPPDNDNDNNNNNNNTTTTTPTSNTKVRPLEVLKQIWIYVLSIFLIFTTTLACFPSLTVLIDSTVSSGLWSQIYFRPVICFLGFNVGDYCGRLLADKLVFSFKYTLKGQLIILLLSLLRLIFIPLFVLCNASPENRIHSSVLFYSDTVYILFMILFSVSNGILSSLCMMNAPKLCLRPAEQSTAASIMVAFLGLGLGCGALSSKLCLHFL